MRTGRQGEDGEKRAGAGVGAEAEADTGKGRDAAEAEAETGKGIEKETGNWQSERRRRPFAQAE